MPLVGVFIVPHPPLIVPEIGKGEEKKIQKTIDSYEEVAHRIAKLQPDTIILTTPHSIMYSDYLHISPGTKAEGSFQDFGAPQVKMEVKYDSEFVNKLEELATVAGIRAGSLGERNKSLDHATMVPMYFINKQYTDYQLVRIALSGLSPLVHYQFGKCIYEAMNQIPKRYVIISSGDLSHKLKKDGPYGLSEEGPIFDHEITQAMANADFLRFLTFDEVFCEAAAECGLRSFIIMSGILDGLAVKPELLSYEGPFGVGYAVAAFEILGEDSSRHFDKIYLAQETQKLELLKSNEDHYIRLARLSLEHYVTTGTPLRRSLDLSGDLTGQKAGVFVSLKMEGRLRGCIGTTSPTTECVADEIIQNAISAGTGDPRFEPVSVNELPRLVYSVDVLREAEPISSMDELDPIRYGVIVKSKGRSGLLLPNLEGIDSAYQQVAIALKKAGIAPSEPYKMERFEVIRHK